MLSGRINPDPSRTENLAGKLHKVRTNQSDCADLAYKYQIDAFNRPVCAPPVNPYNFPREKPRNYYGVSHTFLPNDRTQGFFTPLVSGGPPSSIPPEYLLPPRDRSLVGN